jgi:hypothetical protein
LRQSSYPAGIHYSNLMVLHQAVGLRSALDFLTPISRVIQPQDMCGTLPAKGLQRIVICRPTNPEISFLLRSWPHDRLDGLCPPFRVPLQKRCVIRPSSSGNAAWISSLPPTRLWPSSPQPASRKMAAIWRALLQRHRRLSNFVMSTSPPDFIKFPDGASPSLPDLPRVDS